MLAVKCTRDNTQFIANVEELPSYLSGSTGNKYRITCPICQRGYVSKHIDKDYHSDRPLVIIKQKE